jgi:PIN domain nuclease of toxin-antitoxin system
VNLLLDTCTFLWLAACPQRLSRAAAAALDEPRNTPYLSDASLWEIALRYRLGKLPLPKPPREWVPAQAAFFQVQRLAIEPASIFLSGELPTAHRDPFDRLLAAQALAAAMTVVTPDPPLRSLGCQVVW